jgi:hypothetical protein
MPCPGTEITLSHKTDWPCPWPAVALASGEADGRRYTLSKRRDASAWPPEGEGEDARAEGDTLLLLLLLLLPLPAIAIFVCPPS